MALSAGEIASRVEVGLDAHAAHGGDSFRGEADGCDAVAPGFALEAGIIDAGNGKRRLPVCHGGEHKEMNRLRFHTHPQPRR